MGTFLLPCYTGGTDGSDLMSYSSLRVQSLSYKLGYMHLRSSTLVCDKWGRSHQNTGMMLLSLSEPLTFVNIDDLQLGQLMLLLF